jgi:hypothetical protein
MILDNHFMYNRTIRRNFDVPACRRWSAGKAHPKAYKNIRCSPPWRSIPPQHEKEVTQ